MRAAQVRAAQVRAELDLMATIAGLTLVHRGGGVNGEPYTADSGQHVCVYRFAAP